VNDNSLNEKKETILAESGLKTTQVIDSIKTFRLPMSEFLLRHSNLSLTKLKVLDIFLRKLINKRIGGLPLTREIFYLKSRDDSFGLYSLYDIYHICKIANLGHLLNNCISEIMPHYITQVGLDRNLKSISEFNQLPRSRFFTWHTDHVYSINKMQ
jgi:hypothetical protein